jgi:hypothetical protein
MKNQNVDLQSFWLDLRKYLEILFFVSFDNFWAQITSWH